MGRINLIRGWAMEISEEIERLARLREQGVLSEVEFQQAKEKTLKDSHQSGSESQPPKKRGGWFGKVLLVLLLLIVGFFGIGIVASSSPEAKAKAKNRAAIDLCWRDYDRKDLDAAQKKFIASTCYRMTGDFKRKYGVSP